MRTARGRRMLAWRHIVSSQASTSSSGACRQKNAIHQPAGWGGIQHLACQQLNYPVPANKEHLELCLHARST